MSKITMIEFGLILIDNFFQASQPQNPHTTPRMGGHLAWQWDHVRQGKMRIFSPSGEFDILPGESVISPPWLPHNFHWYEDSVSSSIHFFWPEAPAVSTEKMIKIGAADLDEATLNLFFHYAPYSGAEERRNAAYAFHLTLWKFMQETFPQENAPSNMEEKTRKLVEASNYAPLGVAEMANWFHMSVNNFIRRFKGETGNTPARYVLECRLDRAKDLLRYSDLNITAVALGLGFADLYTFSKAFRKYTGFSPSDWLERHPRKKGGHGF